MASDEAELPPAYDAAPSFPVTDEEIPTYASASSSSSSTPSSKLYFQQTQLIPARTQQIVLPTTPPTVVYTVKHHGIHTTLPGITPPPDFTIYAGTSEAVLATGTIKSTTLFGKLGELKLFPNQHTKEARVHKINKHGMLEGAEYGGWNWELSASGEPGWDECLRDAKIPEILRWFSFLSATGGVETRMSYKELPPIKAAVHSTTPTFAGPPRDGTYPRSQREEYLDGHQAVVELGEPVGAEGG